MSKKLGIKGNYLTVIDSVSGVQEWANPSAQTVFQHRVSGIALKPTTERSIAGSIYLAYADITDINGDAFGSDALIRDFLGSNTGTTVTTVDRNKPTVLVTDDKVLVVGDADYIQLIATDNKDFTLPLITTEMVAAGKRFKFVNTGADQNNDVTLDPNSSDAIHGSIANASSDSVAGGVLDKDLVLTKGTSNKGDWIEVAPYALTEWYITGGVGIWASEG